MCRQVLESRPDDCEALNNLAWVLAMRNQGDMPQALALINRAIELNDSDPSLVDTRAVILIRSGQNDRALEQLRSVQQQSPQDPGVAFHMAWAYRAIGDMHSAQEPSCKKQSAWVLVPALWILRNSSSLRN